MSNFMPINSSKVNKMDKFLEKYKYQNCLQKKQTTKEYVFKELQLHNCSVCTKKIIGTDDFTGKFSETLKEEMPQFYPVVFRN